MKFCAAFWLLFPLTTFARTQSFENRNSSRSVIFSELSPVQIEDDAILLPAPRVEKVALRPPSDSRHLALVLPIFEPEKNQPTKWGLKYQTPF
jgi:hypothetical protein